MNYSQKPDWFLLYRSACLCHCRIFSYSLFIIHRQQDKFNLLLPYRQDNPLYILIIVVRLRRLPHTQKNPALPVIRFHACEEGGDYLKFNIHRITSCLLLQPVLLCTNSVNQTNYIEKLRSSQAINNLRLLQITVLDCVRTVSVPAVYRFVQHYS